MVTPRNLVVWFCSGTGVQVANVWSHLPILICQILFIDCHVWGNTVSWFQVTETAPAWGTEIRGAAGDGEAENYLF